MEAIDHIWAADLTPEGVEWTEPEVISRGASTVVIVDRGERVALERRRLGFTRKRGGTRFYTTERNEIIAPIFEALWQLKFGGRPAPSRDLPPRTPLTDGHSRAHLNAAFRILAKKHHPDNGGSEAKFVALVKARERLLG
jgi:hypothetical protein